MARRDPYADQRRRTVGTVLVVVVALVAAVLVGLAVFDRPTPPATGGTGFVPSQVDEEESGPLGAPLGKTLARLEDDSRPFRVLLIGDSTGVDPKGWQVQLLSWLAKTTGRPWETHQWNQDPAVGPVGYFPPWRYGSGRGAPIELWNGSAGGRGFDYTAEHGDKIAPPALESVDLLLVNHGHNVDPATDYYDIGIPFVESLADRYPGMAIVVMAQNPEKGSPANMDDLDQVLDYVRTFARDRRLPLVDVFERFEATGHPATLIDDTNFHPTLRGYGMWFEMVRDAFVRAAPALGG